MTNINEYNNAGRCCICTTLPSLFTWYAPGVFKRLHGFSERLFPWRWVGYVQSILPFSMRSLFFVLYSILKTSQSVHKCEKMASVQYKFKINNPVQLILCAYAVTQARQFRRLVINYQSKEIALLHFIDQ